MSGIDSASRATSQRSTEDLMDTLAHDAGVLGKDGKDEHVRSSAFGKSSAAAWGGRNAEQGHALGHHAVQEGCAVGMEHAVEHAAHHAMLGAAGGLMAGAAVGLGSVLQLRFLITEGWLKPHMKGDAVTDRQTNDAINLAVVDIIDVPSEFRAATRRERPGAERGAQMLNTQLRKKDAPMVPVLQARSDEGFLEAQKLWKDLSATPANKRGEAFTAGLEAKFKDRLAHDVAFGTGVRLFAWSQSQDEKTRTAVDANVHGRNLRNPSPVAG